MSFCDLIISDANCCILQKLPILCLFTIVYKLSSLFAFRRRWCNFSGPGRAGCSAGEGTAGAKAGQVSSVTPVPFVLPTPRYCPCLRTQPAATAFPSRLSCTHTHTNMQILPFLVTETILRYTYMYADMHLSIYNCIRRAEEVQWWKSGVWIASLNCQSGLKSARQVQVWAQVCAAFLWQEPECSIAPNPGVSTCMNGGLGEASRSPSS